MATCSINTLSAEAVTFQSVDPGQLPAVMAALLCRILQTLDPMATCNVSELMAEGKCFNCVDPGTLQVLIAQLLCNISDAIGGAMGGGVTCGAGVPTVAPAGGCGLYLRTNGQVWIYTAGAWEQKLE